MDSATDPSESRQIVQAFFERLGARNDVEGWLRLLSRDVAVDRPFVPEGEASRLVGIEQINARFGTTRSYMKSFDFMDLEVLATEDPERWLATCRSQGVLGDGRKYQNRYCLIFRIRSARIIGWTEYYDPRELPR
jgi:ketosteroid isomerase-like protein